jgi:hypothetical protein
MIRSSLGVLILFGLFGAITTGCASSPVAPFNQMEKSSVLAFRLQNYEPPAAPAGAAATAGQNPLIPGLPAEINQWIQQGAAGLQQLIPPGILPQNLLQQAQAAAPQAEQVPRFYGFRILGQTQVMDSELRANLGKIFGNPDNYETPKANCLYPELGIAFGPQPGAPTYDYLVSFSCHQVQSKNFAWPHKQTGMNVDMEKDLADLVRKIWPS